MLWTIIISILLGALAGWIAGKIMKSKRGFWGNVILGIAGSFVGGLIAGLLNISGGLIVELLIAVGGACLVLVIFNAIKKK